MKFLPALIVVAVLVALAFVEPKFLFGFAWFVVNICHKH
jgi:hypothetical protein